jgi:serine/threonine protein kinase
MRKLGLVASPVSRNGNPAFLSPRSPEMVTTCEGAARIREDVLASENRFIEHQELLSSEYVPLVKTCRVLPEEEAASLEAAVASVLRVARETRGRLNRLDRVTSEQELRELVSIFVAIATSAALYERYREWYEAISPSLAAVEPSPTFVVWELRVVRRRPEFAADFHSLLLEPLGRPHYYVGVLKMLSATLLGASPALGAHVRGALASLQDLQIVQKFTADGGGGDRKDRSTLRRTMRNIQVGSLMPLADETGAASRSNAHKFLVNNRSVAWDAFLDPEDLDPAMQADPIIVHEDVATPSTPPWACIDRSQLQSSFSWESMGKSKSLKFYFAEFYKDLFGYHRDRLARRALVEQKISNPYLALEAKAAAYGQYCLSETEALRRRRQLPKLKDFRILSKIGEGAFGQVYLCTRNDSEETMVMKKIKKSLLKERNMVDSVKTEREVLKDTKSPWMVQLLYSFQDKENVFMCMEYMPGGDLATLLENLELEEEEARIYAAEMITSVDELHKLGFIHRDLKPDNFLIDAKGHLRLADFGLSKGGVSKKHIADLDKIVPIRVYIQGKEYTGIKTIGAKVATSAGDVTQMLIRKLGIKESGMFLFVEGDGKERALKSHEKVRAIAESFPEVADGESETHRFTFKQLGSTKRATLNAPARHQFRALREQMMQLKVENKAIAHSVVGTPYYMAPEMFSAGGYTHLADAWSIGCLIYELVCGVPPFTGDTAEEVFSNILDWRSSLHFPAPGDDVQMSDDCRDLLSKVLCDEESRLSLLEMQKHPWFVGVEWGDRQLECTPPFVPDLAGATDTTYFDAEAASEVDVDDIGAGGASGRAMGMGMGDGDSDDEFGGFRTFVRM